MQFKSSLSLYQCTLLPICTVATIQLLYAIQILTVTISVHTVTNMYGSHSTVTVCNSNPCFETSPSKEPLPGTELVPLPAETPESSPLLPSDLVEPFSVVSPCPIFHHTIHKWQGVTGGCLYTPISAVLAQCPLRPVMKVVSCRGLIKYLDALRQPGVAL